MKTNLSYIDHTKDPQKIIRSINSNFNQIVFSGVGYKGDYGDQGPIGLTGQMGIPGVTGPTGEFASNWTRSNDYPVNPSKYDYFINTQPGPSGSEIIYYYDGTQWVNTGGSLIRNSVFQNFQGINGPGGLTDKNSIYCSFDTDPQKNTFVFSDYDYSPVDVNPQKSKVRISSRQDAGIPLLSFRKIGKQDTSPTGFYWMNVSEESDNSITFRGDDRLYIDGKKGINFYPGFSQLPITLGGSGANLGLSSNKTSILAGEEVIISSGGTADGTNSMKIGVNLGSSISSRNLEVSSSLTRFKEGSVISYLGETGSSSPIFKINGTLPVGSSTPFSYFESQSTDSLQASKNRETSQDQIYNPEDLPSTFDVPLSDFRLSDQEKGEGIFKTSLVVATKGGTAGNEAEPNPLNGSETPGIIYPSVKIGSEGGTGSYVTHSTKQISSSFSTFNFGEIQKSVVDLSNPVNYTSEWISLITTNTQPPIKKPGFTLNYQNTIWVKIASVNNTFSLDGVYSRGWSNSYRFFYIGNDPVTFNYTSTSQGSFRKNSKFGGFVYERLNSLGNPETAFVDFCVPTPTFKISYFPDERVIFWETADCSGFVEYGSSNSIGLSN